MAGWGGHGGRERNGGNNEHGKEAFSRPLSLLERSRSMIASLGRCF